MRPRRLDLLAIHAVQHEVADDSRKCNDEDHAERRDDEADAAEDTDASCVSQDQAECVPSGAAEVLSEERNLDVRIFVKELDEAFEATNAAPGSLCDLLTNVILLSFKILLQVIQKPFDQLDDGQDEASECQTT